MIFLMVRDSDSEENEFNGLASDLVNVYDEDLSSNMESDTEVNISNFFTIQAYKCKSKGFCC